MQTKLKTFNLMRIIFALLSVFALLSCSNNEKKQIDEYVYIDTKGIIHTDNGCPSVSRIKGGGQPVKILETVLITEKDLESICSQCVKKEKIDAIRLWLAAKEVLDEEAEEKAAEEEYNNHSMGYKIRQWLYVRLDGNTSDMNSWRCFNENLEDQNKRLQIYNEGVRKLLGLPEYSKFCEEIDNYRDDEKGQMFPIDTVAIIDDY